MWVFEEMVNGRKLTEIINTDHENVKYLPGRKLPANVLAVPDLVEASRTDILVFVIPHQLLGKADEGPDGLKLISDVIQEKLVITMSVLMGANIANEVADEKFCEPPLDVRIKTMAPKGTHADQQLPSHRIEEYDVNIVAVGAGFCDGLALAITPKLQ
ncbi:hypothetical protein INR49_007044 [Caranx melampygus]|nr:hypothetical protein INR49_007044 [Caranx melampygus]